MSVYIPGMEMPKAGNWKTIRIYYDGTCAEPNWQGDCKYMQGCEAIPVPDHGDLIDFHFCEQNYEALRDDDGNLVYAVRMAELLKAPTIIPADGGAE